MHAIQQESERRNWALGASLCSLAPIGKCDVHHQCLPLVAHSTASVLFLVPIDRASSCLFTIFASTKLSLGAHQLTLLHTGKVYDASQGPMVFFYFTLSCTRIFCCSPTIPRRAFLSGCPKSSCLSLPHSTQSLQYAPSGLLGLYLGNKAVIIPFACFSHCLKWYSSTSISFCCVKLVA